MDFLCCLPEMAEQTMTKKNLQVPFVEAGMTDKEAKCFPVYDRLLGTRKRYVLMAKDIGLPKSVKLHIKDQFPHLAETFLNNEAGEITYADMHTAGIPRGKCYALCLQLRHRQSHSKQHRSCN